MKRIIASVLAITLMTVSSCSTATIETSAESTDQVVEETLSTDSSYESDDSKSWRQAYIDQIPQIISEFGESFWFTYTLIYLDDDEIPEVFAEGDCEATGEIIFTYNNGEVNYVRLPRRGTQYIPGTGLTYTNTGNMDYYPLSIHSLSDGEFTCIASGLKYISEEGYAPDSADDVYTYEWENQTVTADQYWEHVEEYYDLGQSIYPSGYYTDSEFYTLLTTDMWESANHRYELIVDDCTWEEARQECIIRGGYLAIISCNAEAQAIADLISDQQLDDYYFYTGYICSTQIDGQFYLAGFYNSDFTPAITNYDCLCDFTNTDFPEYEYYNDMWNEDEYDRGILIYFPEENFFHIFNGPDNLNEYDEYSDNVAYICEYDW